MADIVETPLGRKTVLKPEELEKQAKERQTSKYIRQGNGIYKCRDCGETIVTTTIAHPIWHGPFPMSGSGKCIYEQSPYCPKCEPKPDPNGSPVAPKGSYHNP